MNWRDNPYFTIREEFILQRETKTPFEIAISNGVYKICEKNHVHRFGFCTIVVSNKCDRIYKSSMIPDPCYEVESSETQVRVFMKYPNRVKEFSELKLRYGR